MTRGTTAEETHRDGTSHGPVFVVIDADGDGRITLKEYEAGFNLLDR